MTYLLILIVVLQTGGFEATQIGSEHANIDDCFGAREETVKKLGRPLINYQVICVAKDIPSPL